MWNKRRNFFILVKIRTSSRLGFAFPLMMPVIEETMEEIHESFSLLKPLMKGVKPPVVAAMDLPRAGLEIIREVRCLGPCSLVEVHSKDVKVDIRLI